MEIKTLELFIDGDAFWFTLLSFDYKNQNRSLFHIEYGYGCLKFQFLFLKNNCWVYDTNR